VNFVLEQKEILVIDIIWQIFFPLTFWKIHVIFWGGMGGGDLKKDYKFII